MQGAASQHNDCFGLACFHLRDSCVLVRVCCARAHGVDLKKSPGPGRTTRPGPGFVLVWITVNKQEADRLDWSFVFFLNSVLLGVGLAMDAFSVSMANGLHDPKMNKGTMCKIAGTFGIFQAAMPMIGWVCVHTIVELFASFETLIPWIALALLGYIGGKMLLDGIRGEEAEEAAELGAGALFMQGIATSIDALSVGFTISEYGWLMALTAAIIIAVVTFILCMAGLRIGKKFGTQLSGKASILGGVILIGIGLEIFITGVF